jgi:hypothetical protein
MNNNIDISNTNTNNNNTNDNKQPHPIPEEHQHQQQNSPTPTTPKEGHHLAGRAGHPQMVEGSGELVFLESSLLSCEVTSMHTRLYFWTDHGAVPPWPPTTGKRLGRVSLVGV